MLRSALFIYNENTSLDGFFTVWHLKGLDTKYKTFWFGFQSIFVIYTKSTVTLRLILFTFVHTFSRNILIVVMLIKN